VKNKSTIWLPLVIMVAFALTRWPGLMPQNFSAAYALAFCAGIFFPGRLRWVLPLATLIATDLALNVFYYKVAPFNIYLVVNLGVFALLIWLGKIVSSKASWFKMVGGGILGACIFYIVTNFVSWLYDPAYAKTLAGLFQALTIGTPGWPHTWEFFRNTLMSGGLFTGLFCGAMKLSEAAQEKEEEAEEESGEKETAPEESPA
jgi:hypothetical protein